MADTETNPEFALREERVVDSFLPFVQLRPLLGFPQTFEAQNAIGETFVISAENRLQSMIFTDNDKKRDKLEITFIDDEGVFADPKTLAHGSAVEFIYGYPGHVSVRRLVIVKRLKLGMVQGRRWAKRRRGFLVTIEGYDSAFEFHTRPAGGGEVFENMTLATIVRTVAERMGYHESLNGSRSLTIDIPADYNGTLEAVTLTAGMSYAQFLAKLSADYDAVWRQNASGMYFGFQDPTRAGDHVVDLNGTHLLGFDLDGDLILGAPGSLTVEGYRPGTQELVRVTKTYREAKKGRGKGSEIAITSSDAQASQTGEAGQVEPAPDEPDSAVVEGDVVRGIALYKGRNQRARRTIVLDNRVKEDFRPTTIKKASAKVTAAFLERIKRTWKLRIRLVGDPTIGARNTVELRNFDTPLLDGVWYIREARHTIDPNGYVTELQCNRQIGGRGLSGKIEVRNVRKTARTNEDKESDFEQTGQFEGIAAITGVRHDTSGVYKAHTYKSRR